MVTQCRIDKFRGGLAGKISVIESCAVARKQNLRAKARCEIRAGSVRPGAQSAKELIGDTGLSDMEDDGISRLGVIENEVGRRSRRVPFVVEVVTLDEGGSLHGKQQHHHECRWEQPAVEPR